VIETKLIVIDLDKQFTFDLPAPPILAVMVRKNIQFAHFRQPLQVPNMCCPGMSFV